MPGHESPQSYSSSLHNLSIRLAKGLPIWIRQMHINLSPEILHLSSQQITFTTDL